MSHFYDSRLEQIVDSRTVNKAELCQFVTKAKGNLYTDDANFRSRTLTPRRKKCLLYYVDDTFIVFYDSYQKLIDDLESREEELDSVFYEGELVPVLYDDSGANEVRILFKI